jgi:hypothetical protein
MRTITKSTRPKWSKWKVIGEIGLDTASILICDPCYVIPKDSQIARRYNKDWHGFVEEWEKSDRKGAPKMPELPPDLTNRPALKNYLEKQKQYLRRIKRFKRQPCFNLNYDAGHKGLATIVSTGADGVYQVEMRERGPERELRIRF